MTDELSLGGVVRSFEESSLILDQLREKLVSLASSDEIRQESSDSLQKSAGQLAELTSELGSAVDQLSAVGGQLGAAVAVTEAQLSTLSPDAVLGALGEQRDGLQALSERVDALHSDTHSSLETLTGELAVSRTIIERQSAELATLRSKVAGLPERLRRKHGLDEARPLPPPGS